MGKIKRWLLDRQQVIWSEPELPKYVKINPLSPPGAAEGLQPGDFSMLKIAEEFLEKDEEFVAGPEAPEEGLALSDAQAFDLLAVKPPRAGVDADVTGRRYRCCFEAPRAPTPDGGWRSNP